MSFLVFCSFGLDDDTENELYHDVDDVDDVYEPICSFCHKPITFLDYIKHGKCKECRGR